MLIDWFTVFAQIVNFLVLIFLLKRFLYGRIIRAMDQREGKIASRLAEAEEKWKEAEGEAQKFRGKNEELAARREELLRQVRDEADSRKEDLIQKARKEVEGMQSRWRDSLDKEKEDFLRDLRRLAAAQVFAVARRSLAELADAELERQAVDVFIRRLRGMPPQELEQMKAILRRGGKEVIIRTAIELSGDDRDRLQRAVRESLADQLEVSYQTSPDLVLGVEMKVDGRKVAWSVDHYLRSLESETAEVLEGETRSRGEKQTQKDPRNE